jgi:predicted  nucleic acid-binding Zn-ribbon protein
LQETDLQVQHYNARIELLPKQLAALETKLNGTLQSLEANKQQIAKAASDKKKLEGNVQDLEQKNSKYRGQLTDVKTNEQYKALLHEIFNEKEVRKIERYPGADGAGRNASQESRPFNSACSGRR